MIHRHAGRQRGFSLIELAIGLVIVATLLSALLVPLATQMDQRRTAETQRALEAARDALMGFAMANGRLPCPAADTTNGIESITSGLPATGDCAAPTGFLPAVTLGLDGVSGSGMLLDAFGGPVRYAVAMPTDVALANVFTKTNGIRTVTIRTIADAALPAAAKFLFICSAASTAPDSCSAGATLANGNVIAVVYSQGKNGTDTVRTLATDEAENLPEANDRVFVSRVRNDQTGYDDMLVWISPATLISRMTAGGALP